MNSASSFALPISLIVSAVVLSGCFLTSCADVSYGRLEFFSPDKSTSVVATFPRLINHGVLTLSLARPNAVRTLLTWRGEVFLDFLDVVWVSKALARGKERTPDGRDAVLIVFSCGDPKVRLAFDRDDSREITYAPFEATVKASIRAKYEVPRGLDPILWACSDAGVSAFRRRFGL